MIVLGGHFLPILNLNLTVKLTIPTKFSFYEHILFANMKPVYLYDHDRKKTKRPRQKCRKQKATTAYRSRRATGGGGSRRFL